MFYGACDFNGDISGWDTSNVNNMSWMFYDDSNFYSNVDWWIQNKTNFF